MLSHIHARARTHGVSFESELVSVSLCLVEGENATVTEASKDSVEIVCRVDNTDITVQSLKWKRNDTVIMNNTEKYIVNSTGTETTLNITQLSMF